MKKPYFNEQERESIYLNTTIGDLLLLNIACKKLCREIIKELNEWYIFKIIKKILNKI